MKITYEAMYHSRKSVLDKIDAGPLLKELCGGPQADIEIFVRKTLKNAQPIPGIFDRWRMRSNHMDLSFYSAELQLWVQFRFGRLFHVLKYEYDE